MCDLTTAYANLKQQAQAICDTFPYAEPLTATVSVGTNDRTGAPFVLLQARFEGMGVGREAELKEMGVGSPRLFAFTRMCADEATALAELAAELGLARATAEQKRGIISLLNHPAILKTEKSVGMLNLDRYTEEVADEVMAGLKKDINARSKHVVYPEVAEYAVVGEAFQVAVEQAA